MINKITLIPAGEYDRRPANVEGIIKGKTSVFYLDKATGIRICSSSLIWGRIKPDYFAHSLESYGVSGLKISGFDGVAAFPSKLPAQVQKK